VSAGAHVAVLTPARASRASGAGARRQSRSALTLAAFAALGLYGVARWATLLKSPPTARLLCLVALAVAVAGFGELARARSRVVQIAAIAGVYVCSLAVLPVSGFPWHWATHFEVARTLNAVDAGTRQLPDVLVPYGFASASVRDVIVLGAGLLLLVGGLTLAALRSGSGELRLIGAAIPLVVLAIVPSTLSTPQFAYLHGAILFVLLAALVFSERVRTGRELLATGAVLIAACGGMLAAPAIDRHRAWVRVNSLAGSNGPPRHGEAFNWSQTYGPLRWPHNGTVVLDVRAQRAYFWKAEDLDLFDGRGWAQADIGTGPMAAQATIAPRNLNRWLQTLTVSLLGMHSSAVIGGGYAFEPVVLGPQQTPVQNLEAGAVPGTWVTTSPMQSGNSYQIRVYTPAPRPAALQRAGTDYPLPALLPELEMLVPASGSPSSTAPARLSGRPVLFEPYGSPHPIQGLADMTATQVSEMLARSPYGPVYALAQRLKLGTDSPYAFVQAVMRYLRAGFVYDQTPPVTRYPIASFLLRNRRGYCQQFAGAMALLLRMGGVPARVAAGFATGVRVRHTNEYVVTDRDAHAWVEAWFPTYGWVKFDPTPPTPASNKLPAASREPGAQKSARRGLGQRSSTAGHGSGAGSTGGRGAGGSDLPLASGAVIVVGLLLGAVAWCAWTLIHLRAARRGPEALLAELERAFVICGRPIAGGATLEALEREVGGDPEAANYVRSIRLARFARGSAAVDPAGRRAMRRVLRDGLGPSGAARALIALPPLPARALRPAGVLH
jgi:transglutaminase-like putative cysteine protease